MFPSLINIGKKCSVFLHVGNAKPLDDRHVDTYIHVILRLQCSDIKLSQLIVGHLSFKFIKMNHYTC